jgi:HEAT repeat protein
MEPVITALFESLSDPDEQVRILALKNLGLIGQHMPLTVSAGFVAATRDRSADVRAAALGALSDSWREVDFLVEPLFKSLEDESEPVRWGSDQALRQIKPTAAVVPFLIERLRQRDELVQFHAADLLRKMGRDAASALPALTSRLRAKLMEGRLYPTQDGNPPDTVGALCLALASIANESASPAETVAVLVEVLKAEDPDARRSAADALAKMGARATPALPALIATMREAAATPGFSGYGEATAAALGTIGPNSQLQGEVISALVDALKSDSSYTRAEAALSLARFGPAAKTAIPQIRERLADEDQSVRTATHATLRVLGAHLPVSQGSQ